MENLRNKQFRDFKLCAVLHSMTKHHTILSHSISHQNHPLATKSVIYILLLNSSLHSHRLIVFVIKQSV